MLSNDVGNPDDPLVDLGTRLDFSLRKYEIGEANRTSIDNIVVEKEW